MSRTKKDLPIWVQLNDRTQKFRETHDHHLFGAPHYYWEDGERKVNYVVDYCTIDQPQQHHSHDWGAGKEPPEPCTRWFYKHNKKGWYKTQAGKTDIHNWSTIPVRRNMRKVLNRAIRDYNTDGVVDDELYITIQKQFFSKQNEY